MDIYVEKGTKRVFAAAVGWPGWARAGRDEAAALSALLNYGRRYRRAIGAAGGKLALPANPTDLHVVERLTGNATTDFGAPGIVPQLDHAPVDDAELERLIAIHGACWATFERVAESAKGRPLAPAGPRGGGRSLDKIRAHVVDAEGGYTNATGGSWRPEPRPRSERDAFVATLRQRAAGKLADVGPRGGKRWRARYAVRRSAWHLLDHAWEIEDRVSGS